MAREKLGDNGDREMGYIPGPVGLGEAYAMLDADEYNAAADEYAGMQIVGAKGAGMSQYNGKTGEAWAGAGEYDAYVDDLLEQLEAERELEREHEDVAADDAEQEHLIAKQHKDDEQLTNQIRREVAAEVDALEDAADEHTGLSNRDYAQYDNLGDDSTRQLKSYNLYAGGRGEVAYKQDQKFAEWGVDPKRAARAKRYRQRDHKRAEAERAQLLAPAMPKFSQGDLEWIANMLKAGKFGTKPAENADRKHITDNFSEGEYAQLRVAADQADARYERELAQQIAALAALHDLSVSAVLSMLEVMPDLNMAVIAAKTRRDINNLGIVLAA
jgi:hypothetical protein